VNTCFEPELVLHGGAPIHCQIAEQVRDCILSGQLRPGDQLATVRAVAAELGVNPNTVTKAYTELEREGYLTTEDASGTFVAAPACREARRERLEQLCAGFLAGAAAEGFSPAEVLHATRALTQRRSFP
jgi:GntR family transcriptional regulator